MASTPLGNSLFVILATLRLFDDMLESRPGTRPNRLPARLANALPQVINDLAATAHSVSYQCTKVVTHVVSRPADSAIQI
jgi:hypothetical protein